MKTIGLFFLIALFFACTSQREMATEKRGRLGIQDSARYELVVFDTGFDYWIAANKNRVPVYSDDYYQTANDLLAMEWNRRYAMGDRNVQSYINYHRGYDYGFDFNYKLFMYFKFWEEENKTTLVPGF